MHPNTAIKKLVRPFAFRKRFLLNVKNKKIMKIEELTTKKLSNVLADKFDDILIEGLKRKGFEFNHKIHLEYFIQERCECVDDVKRKTKIYYVDNNPFLAHNYSVEFIQDFNTNEGFKVSASLGSFTYL